MKQTLAGKLTLKKETLAALDAREMNNVKGGLLSIGQACSARNSCDRAREKKLVASCCE